MKTHFISIVIPSLNEEKYLPKLLDDLEKQTYTDFEVIVVDGHSEDKTVEKCSGYKKKLPSLLIINSKKRNVSYQRNLGGLKAKGKWIIFMDADNRLPKYYLDGIKYRILKDSPDFFTSHFIADSDKKDDVALVKLMNIGLEITNFMDSPTTAGALMGVKRKLFNDSDGFDENILYAEDMDYFRRLHKNGKTYKLFKDPQYVISLRHYRRDGKLKLIARSSKLQLKNLAGLPIDQLKEYPMGGAFSETKDANELSVLFSNIQTALKKPKILRKLKTYLSYLEEE